MISGNTSPGLLSLAQWLNNWTVLSPVIADALKIRHKGLGGRGEVWAGSSEPTSPPLPSLWGDNDRLALIWHDTVLALHVLPARPANSLAVSPQVGWAGVLETWNEPEERL